MEQQDDNISNMIMGLYLGPKPQNIYNNGHRPRQYCIYWTYIWYQPQQPCVFTGKLMHLLSKVLLGSCCCLSVPTFLNTKIFLYICIFLYLGLTFFCSKSSSVFRKSFSLHHHNLVEVLSLNLHFMSVHLNEPMYHQSYRFHIEI